MKAPSRGSGRTVGVAPSAAADPREWVADCGRSCGGHTVFCTFRDAAADGGALMVEPESSEMSA